MKKNIICIANSKGGVGKTTTAINLAACLALLEKKTLLIDCDPLGNATTGIGIDKGTLKYNFFHSLIGKVSLKNIVCNTNIDFLKFIPAGFELNNANVLLKNKQDTFYDILLNFDNDFEYIIIDCPPSIGFLSSSAIIASNWILIPMQPQVFIFEGLKQLLNQVQQLKSSQNLKPKILGLLFTMTSKDEVNTLLSNSEMTMLKPSVLQTIIAYDDQFCKSSNIGQPLILVDIKSKGSNSYMKLAIEIMKIIEQSKI